MAAGDLTALADVKAWLFTQTTPPATDDALLERLISAASQFIQTWCNRDFASQSYTEAWDGTGGRRMMFPNYPVTAVSSVAVSGITMPRGSITSAGYYFTSTALILNGYGFERGFANIEVAYTAGYPTIPPELAQACIELVGVRYRERDRIGMSSKAVGGETTSFSLKDMPASVSTILNNYRKVIPT